MSDNQHWLISAPGENTPQKTWERLNQATSAGPETLSTNFKFNIPELRVGTLDVLVGLTDDLGKLDAYTECVTRRLAQYLGEVLGDTGDKLKENLKIGDATPAAYLHKFTWDGAKYPVKQSLRFLTDLIGKQVVQIKADLKTKATTYSKLKANIKAIGRRASGSLMTRDLTDLVKKEDFVVDSDYLVTLIVVVPRKVAYDWFEKYETLSEMVVPRSSKIICEDCDNLLVNVTVFQKVVDEFRERCRKNRFVVRDFAYDEREIQDAKTEVSRLATEMQKQYILLVKWLKINFGECFSAWMHIKALRVFVESVLRYGLPVNFQAVVMQPNRRYQKRLRGVLHQLYCHLDNVSAVDGATAAAAGMDIPGLNLASSDYYPYVYFRINLDLLDAPQRK